MLIAKGSFKGDSGHTLEGTFTLIRQADGTIAFETDEGFKFDGSPNPGWALYTGVPGNDQDPAVHADMVRTRFGSLPGGALDEQNEVTGKQFATIPAEADLSAYDTIILWCFTFPTTLGHGKIEAV
ncbi:MAG: DM13 domain-containing protein [Pseudomonadota bacterium]